MNSRHETTTRYSKSRFLVSILVLLVISKRPEKRFLLMLTLVLGVGQKCWRINFCTAKVLCNFEKIFSKMLDSFRNFRKLNVSKISQ